MTKLSYHLSPFVGLLLCCCLVQNAWGLARVGGYKRLNVTTSQNSWNRTHVPSLQNAWRAPNSTRDNAWHPQNHSPQNPWHHTNNSTQNQWPHNPALNSSMGWNANNSWGRNNSGQPRYNPVSYNQSYPGNNQFVPPQYPGQNRIQNNGTNIYKPSPFLPQYGGQQPNSTNTARWNDYNSGNNNGFPVTNWPVTPQRNLTFGGGSGWNPGSSYGNNYNQSGQTGLNYGSPYQQPTPQHPGANPQTYPGGSSVPLAPIGGNIGSSYGNNYNQTGQTGLSYGSPYQQPTPQHPGANPYIKIFN